MNLTDLLGGPLCWVKTIDHLSCPSSATDNDALYCGAVAIGIGMYVIMLRYRWPDRTMPLSEIGLDLPLMLTRYDADQGQWGMRNIADCSFARANGKWGHWHVYPVSRPGVITKVTCLGNSFCLELDNCEALHICLRPDLDATLLVSCQPDVTPSPSTAAIGEQQQLYGWLRPDGAYGLFWNARSWVNVDAAWLWERRHLEPATCQALFKAIYRQMLEQHPSLQRRLAAIEQPILWEARPEVGIWIDEVRQELRLQFVTAATACTSD